MEEIIKKQTIPWAERKGLGFFQALWQTIIQVLLKPGEFFYNVEIEKSLFEPFYFYLVIYMSIATISAIVTLLSKKGITLIQFFTVLIVMPLFLAVGIFLITGILHLFVLLFRGKGGLRGTFNVVAYNSATAIFSIVPVIGILVTWIWHIVVGIIGFKKVHKFSTIKAVFTYLLLPIVSILFLMAAIAIPNLLRARLTANEAGAQATLRTISTAIETYTAVNKNRYPSDEYDLVYAQPPYLNKFYNNETIQGYRYSLDFKPNGYEVIALPEQCGTTGTKIFKIKTGGAISEEACK